MNLRAPSVPLITIDPYFSLWSDADKLTDKTVVHWTGKDNTFTGIANIDGADYSFMGGCPLPKMEQTGLFIDALSTVYTFLAGGVKLEVKFLCPLLPTNLYLLTRPVGYVEVKCKAVDGKEHSVKVSLSASEELCLDKKGQSPVTTEVMELESGVKLIKMGNEVQKPLWQKGDDVRIDWGYFYLGVKGGTVLTEKKDMTLVTATADLRDGSALFILGYDDVYSINYFGEPLKSYWNRDGESILTAIDNAFKDYEDCAVKAKSFSDNLFTQAVRAGGEKYAELLSLAYRQVIAAHKLVVDKNGDILYISKECFSNGCAATADVSYPSVPMYLYYNPELIKGMLRPIFKYSASGDWEFDFAPHDVGCYPILTGQVYGSDTPENWVRCQMPTEECGNMLIMTAAMCIKQGDPTFARENLELLTKWADYLIKNGADPDNQLCTDDFAGHLAHNCNLSLKAIMALEGMGKIMGLLCDTKKAAYYHQKAADMADTWTKTAANGDGSYRLAFDRPGSFSLKYNIIWDKLWGTELFKKEVLLSEFHSYKKRINPYGMPLDNRESYTKSDWLTWVACLGESRADFEEFIAPVWTAYNNTKSRVPMGDWYDSVTALQCYFQHRSVQGGLFMKLLF